MSIRTWVAQRPWIWVVLLLGLMTSLSLLFVAISLAHPPVAIEKTVP